MEKTNLKVHVDIENPRELGFDGCGAHTHGYGMASETNVLRNMLDYGSEEDIGNLVAQISDARLETEGTVSKVYSFQISNPAGLLVYNRVVQSEESAEKLASIKIDEINAAMKARGFETRITLKKKP